MTDQFLTYLRAEKRYSEHTIEAYAKDISQFIEFLQVVSAGRHISSGDGQPVLFDPSAVATDDIREWILDLSARNLSASTVNRKTSSLRSFFRYMRKTGMTDTDPFLGVSMRKAGSRLPVFVSESKMTDIVSMLEDDFGSEDFTTRRNSMLVTLFYTTGLRTSELRSVRIGDFSADFTELKVMGKGGKERIVPIIGHTKRKIVDFLDGFNDSGYCISPDLSLFLTEKGKPLSRSEIYKIVCDAMERAGVQGKKSPHVLRHTFATHMMNGGADIREIQEILGHNSLAATQIYTHNSIVKLKEAYRKAHPRSTDNAPGKSGKEKKE